MRTGIFVGSFDPFTIGHDNIVRRALPLFDRLIIGIGVNERKQYLQDADTRKRKIQELYRNESRITVKTYSDLTIDFAKREKADFIVKGVRSAKDFEYEREQADINRRLGVSLTDSGLMVPQKTVTAVVGVSDRPQPRRCSGCESCAMAGDCAFRREGKTCGK